MKYLQRFKNIKKNRFIEKIINDEIDKSKKFGLEIESHHIKIEKKLIKFVFIEFWEKIIDVPSSYNEYRRIIGDFIFNKLSDISKYYYDKSINDDVRNKYNCHITSVIDKLMMSISNLKN